MDSSWLLTGAPGPAPSPPWVQALTCLLPMVPCLGAVSAGWGASSMCPGFGRVGGSDLPSGPSSPWSHCRGGFRSAGQTLSRSAGARRRPGVGGPQWPDGDACAQDSSRWTQEVERHLCGSRHKGPVLTPRSPAVQPAGSWPCLSVLWLLTCRAV